MDRALVGHDIDNCPVSFVIIIQIKSVVLETSVDVSFMRFRDKTGVTFGGSRGAR